MIPKNPNTTHVQLSLPNEANVCFACGQRFKVDGYMYLVQAKFKDSLKVIPRGSMVCDACHFRHRHMYKTLGLYRFYGGVAE